MRRWLSIMTVSLLVSPAVGSESKIESQWPAWRGPNLNGLVDGGNPPVEWSETKNIKWKTAIPGAGHATPILWGDRVYLQSAVATEGGKCSRCWSWIGTQARWSGRRPSVKPIPRKILTIGRRPMHPAQDSPMASISTRISGRPASSASTFMAI